MFVAGEDDEDEQELDQGHQHQPPPNAHSAPRTQPLPSTTVVTAAIISTPQRQMHRDGHLMFGAFEAQLLRLAQSNHVLITHGVMDTQDIVANLTQSQHWITRYKTITTPSSSQPPGYASVLG